MPHSRVISSRKRHGYRVHRVALAVVRIVDDEMDVVAHKAPSDKLNIVFREDCVEDVKQSDSVLVTVKQQLSSVSAQCDVEITGW